MDSETESIATDATPTKAEPLAKADELVAADAKNIVEDEENVDEDEGEDEDGEGDGEV